MFAEIYKAIETELVAAFPKVSIHDVYPQSKKIEKVPAIFFELTDFEPVDDPMTGQIDFETHWEARIITPPRALKSQLTARDMAAQIALAIHNKTFVDYAKPAHIVRCADDNFDLSVAGYEVWVCEWTQVVRLGASDWDSDAMYPELAKFPQGEPSP